MTESGSQDGAPRAAGQGRKKRVLSGMRPTGPLHLGHYFGALSNWVQMQSQYDCFFFVADWHALTTHYAEDTRLVPQNTLEIALDWLSTGIDPQKSTLFVQSMVPEHAELHLLLSMITPLEWLERVPTYKEQIAQLREKDLGTYGFLGYPLLQTADIVMYGEPVPNSTEKRLFVPVGADQVPHIELSREIVRRFNALFAVNMRREAFSREYKLHMQEFFRKATLQGLVPPAAQDLVPAAQQPYSSERKASIREIFVTGVRDYGFANFMNMFPEAGRLASYDSALEEPSAMLTETPRFPGTDGRRMAKSYGNAIWLRDEPDEIRKKVLAMLTDPQRVRRTDPGRPEICPVFAYHKLFSDNDVVAWAESGCRSAGIGCVQCKRAMAENLIKWIAPVQQRRKEFQADPDGVRKILVEGSERAREVAQKTMGRVREAIFGHPVSQSAKRGADESKPSEPLWSESD